MIDSLVIAAIKKHGKPPGDLVCLGDQEVMGQPGKPCAMLAKELGYTHRDIDYNGHAIINHNLNRILPLALHQTADILYDGGVMEHVANIGQALSTMVHLVKVGGLIIGNWPVSCPVYESYYCINPQLPRDFFSINGFMVLEHRLYTRMNWKLRIMRFMISNFPKLAERIRIHLKQKGSPRVKSFVFRDNPGDVSFHKETNSIYIAPLLSQIFVARRLQFVPEIIWPCQEFYPTDSEIEIGNIPNPRQGQQKL
jgi:hypothetical protein